MCPWTFTYKLDLDMIKMNNHGKYLLLNNNHIRTPDRLHYPDQKIAGYKQK